MRALAPPSAEPDRTAWLGALPRFSVQLPARMVRYAV
jgi:hypothetical protein